MDLSPAIETRDLRKIFGDNVAVKGLTLQVKQGEVFGFLGPNGAGKTTSIKMLLGLIAPTSGSASLLGMPLGDLPSAPEDRVPARAFPLPRVADCGRVPAHARPVVRHAAAQAVRAASTSCSSWSDLTPFRAQAAAHLFQRDAPAHRPGPGPAERAGPGLPG